MKRIVVAAGLIRGPVEGPRSDRYLVSRRLADAHLAHSWEFPGGKVEPGEAPDAALAREIVEELGVEVAVGDIFAVGHHVYPEKEVILLVYDARMLEGTPKCLGVAEFAWLTAGEIVALPLPPADVPVVERLRRERL